MTKELQFVIILSQALSSKHARVCFNWHVTVCTENCPLILLFSMMLTQIDDLLYILIYTPKLIIWRLLDGGGFFLGLFTLDLSSAKSKSVEMLLLVVPAQSLL